MDDLIVKGRGKGKTYALILKSAATGYPIITPYDTNYISMQARDMGVHIPSPVSCRTLMRNGSVGRMGLKLRGKVLLDEADKIAEMLIGAEVDSMTITPKNLIL